ncbi:uncharacterized protein C2845_PM15G18040 [Panicum miliaceum]|uniref:Uncharacterized protein n=1 Tax=Panicum miliaceum TaxID=4540 RepID=A0A3L6Q902_PANMI|nr:uncharacterized protein C2845_PM15G18040 [Panicum miliaceum]
MVVLMEELNGLSLKRKGADEPELFEAGADDRSGFPLSCRATKMRRLACPAGGPQHQGAPAEGVAAAGQDDVPMYCDDDPAPASGGGEEEGALVLYGGGGRSDAASARGAPRLAVRGGADWVRAMLREADSRTVRELLAGAAQEQGCDDLALAVVPWVPPSPAGEEAEPSTAAEEADDDGDEGAAAMEVEEGEAPGLRWTGQACGNGAAEGLVYRWPQHCMAPPQMPAVAQPSPVMWSW